MNRPARLCLAAIAIGLSVGPALADPAVPPLLPEAVLANSPVGTWSVLVTTYDCATLHANPPFESLLSFGLEGNEAETTSNPMLLPGQRTPALGTWGFTGFRSIALVTKAYILFPSPAGPIHQGSQAVRHAIRLTSDHTFIDDATITYSDMSGHVTLTGCASATGQRL